MNVSTEYITLDLRNQDSMTFVTVRQGDTAVRLSAMITESGTPYTIADGASAVLAAQKPDGTNISADCSVTEDNRVEVTLPATFTATIGKHTACFILSDNDGQLTTPPFTIYVDAAAATI